MILIQCYYLSLILGLIILGSKFEWRKTCARSIELQKKIKENFSINFFMLCPKLWELQIRPHYIRIHKWAPPGIALKSRGLVCWESHAKNL